MKPSLFMAVILLAGLFGCASDDGKPVAIPSIDDQIKQIQDNPNLSEDSKQRAIAGIRQQKEIADRMTQGQNSIKDRVKKP